MDRDKVLRKYNSEDFRERRNNKSLKDEKKEGSLIIFQSYISAIIVFGIIIMTIAGGDGSRKILDEMSNILSVQIPFNEIVEKGKEAVENIKIFGDKSIYESQETGEEGFIPDTSQEGKRIYMNTNQEDSGKMSN